MPDELPKQPRVIWRQTLTAQSMAGLAATRELLIVADRDASDSQDIFRCLRTESGEEVWKLQYSASGKLDYGNGPRATPWIEDDHVYLGSAFGVLHCVRLATGEVVWKKDLWDEFDGRDKTNPWGTSSSPLIVDGMLIVNPGGAESAIVGLQPDTGHVIWRAPGARAAFSSFVVGQLGGRRQIVGYEKNAVCGLDPATGERLWTLQPPHGVDFNVPTPIVVDGKLLLTTENHGTRLFAFDDQGRIVPEPIATNDDLAPDTHTPIVLGQRVFGVWLGMNCLDLAAGLETIWRHEEEAFDDYAVVIGHDQRVLVISKYGELILLDAAADEFKPISRVTLFEDDPGVYSHPAMLGTRLFLRGSAEVICVDLAEATGG